MVEHEFTYLSTKGSFNYWNDTFNFHLTPLSFAGNEFIYSQLKSALNTQMRAYLQFYMNRLDDPPILLPSDLHFEIIEEIRRRKEEAIDRLREGIRSIFKYLNARIYGSFQQNKRAKPLI